MTPLDPLVQHLTRLWSHPTEIAPIARAIRLLDTRYDLARKLSTEPGVAEIIKQMAGRLSDSYPKLLDIRNQSILDIACGSLTSRLPASGFLQTLQINFDPLTGYTALFEPWFCRLLLELGAHPVGIDFGSLDGELFEHHHVDLGTPGALDYLPAGSFDALQDSRLFGSPEFTAQFPRSADRLTVAREIVRQETRLLKPGGLIIHSDAAAMLD
jgi:hypothetical protein